MKLLHRWAKPISGLLVFGLVFLQLPIGRARTAMIGTERLLDVSETEAERERIRVFLAREDVRAQFVSLGISPEEATARVDALSNREVKQLTAKLDKLPAGQGAFVALIVAAGALFLLLVVTDLIGMTDLFPFIKKQRKSVARP